MPPHPRPYRTTYTTRVAASYAASYKHNPRNLEAPTYGMHNAVLNDLVRDCPTAFSIPQHDLDVASVVWKMLQGIPPPRPPTSRPHWTRSSARQQGHSVLQALPQDVIIDDGSTEWADEAIDIIQAMQGLRLEMEEADFTSSGPSLVSAEGSSRSERSYHGDTESGAGDEVATGVRARRAQAMMRRKYSFAKSESGITEPDKDALERTPDFVILHTLTRRMKFPDTSDDIRAERYMRCCGRGTHHACIILIEEDKAGPSRRVFGTYVYGQAARELKHAQDNLAEYLAAYFIADVDTDEVLIRSTSGQFWRWAVIHRDEVAQWDHAKRNAKSDPVNAEKLRLFTERMENLPIYRLGTLPSDKELNRLKRRLHRSVRACYQHHH
ncbi:hypothetical protein GGG16DRAFT_115168 [Schizophyllum commune]|nr:hypothetical protein K525DRAFT_272496 [Schizophyllum commune Loenen D]